VLLLLCARVSAQVSDSLKQAAELVKQGFDLVDKGKLDEALAVYKQGALLDPNNSTFQYEMGVVYYLKKDYTSSIKILESVKNKADANDQYFQMLGNAYDLSGQTAKARKTYSDGLIRFPKSGVLFLESGVLEYMHKNTPGAVRFWEAGIIAAPGFTSNYYWLSKYYASTPEKVWAVMYGEMFINLERNTERTQEISALLYRLYQSSVIISKDSVSADFTKGFSLHPQTDQKLPFEQVFQQTMLLAADSLRLSGTDSLDYEAVCKLKGLFIYYWYALSYGVHYPCILFDWIHSFPLTSYLECYHRWVFLKGNEDRFQAWYYSNPDFYNAFVKWFRRNPLGVSNTQYFSRSLY
jgi:tetratricopeptide (TPR) repeat protein